ncbi:MAG: hypothetical protein R2813_04280 [Flavobacteriales bacterium]
MKKLFILTCMMLITCSFHAQNTSNPNVREIGITTSKFSFESIPFNLIYKKGNGNKFWRYEAGYIGGELDFPETRLDTLSYSEKGNSIGFGINLGREIRKPITDKFTFYHGPKVGLSGSYSDYVNKNIGYDQFRQPVINTSKNLNYSITPRLGYMIGAIFGIKDNLYLSVDLAPSVYYRLTYQKSENNQTSKFGSPAINEALEHNTGFNFTQGAVQVGLFYTFQKS